MVRWFVIAVLGTLWSGVALANWSATQSVTASVKGQKKLAKLNWYVGTSGFRLEAKVGEQTRHYVFNGRVFQVCSQLNSVQVAYLQKAQFKDKSILAALKKGACQEAPLDFAVKFFLSPAYAVLDEAGGAGLKTYLAIKGLNVALQGNAENIAGQKCVGMERSFDLQDKANGTSGEFKSSECHAPSLKWRSRLAMELRKKLMMQPAGRVYQKELQSDAGKRKGLFLRGEVTYGGFTAKVSTTNFSKKKPSKQLLAAPKGFKVFNMKSAVMRAQVMNDTKAAAKKAPAGAMIQVLLLGGNPASAFISAGDEE